MKEILKRNLELGIFELPSNAGVVACFSKDQMLLCEMTSNISSYIEQFMGEEAFDKEHGKLFQQTDRIGYRETDKVFEALLGKKGLIQKYHPSYNQRLHAYDKYVYLGINFKHVPYIKAETTTINNYFYVGPFRSRFFVHDVIDVILENFGSPACPGSDFPCELMESGKCPGYCIKPELDLPDNLLNNYLLPQEDTLKILLEQKEKLLNNLQFYEAQNIDMQWKTLKKYYTRISFLMVTKHINLDYEYMGKRIKIKNGLLEEYDNRKYNNVIREYQANELYAVEKSELDERWVIFNEVKSMIPKELLSGYEISKKNLIKYVKGQGINNERKSNQPIDSR